MAATVDLVHYTGSSGAPTTTTVTSLNTRFNTSDTHASSGTSNPLPIPASSTNYSFWVALRAKATVTPATAINNLRVYMDASVLPTGVTFTAQEGTAYVQATGTVGTTGTQLTVGNYASLTGTPVDPFTWTSGSPKSIAGSISNPSTGPFGSWFVLQEAVASTTAAGATVAAQTLTLVFDEA